MGELAGLCRVVGEHYSTRTDKRIDLAAGRIPAIISAVWNRKVPLPGERQEVLCRFRLVWP